jgi:two-component system response regulator HydG
VMTIDELERRYIMRVIKLVDGNKSRASQLLGLDRRTLYRKLDRYRASDQRAQQPQQKERPTMFEGRA